MQLEEEHANGVWVALYGACDAAHAEITERVRNAGKLSDHEP
ncbi:hypothetical protein [Microbispora triticiradicis]|nr:hypothetical protein [Microbispora triticiradicis]